MITKEKGVKFFCRISIGAIMLIFVLTFVTGIFIFSLDNLRSKNPLPSAQSPEVDSIPDIYVLSGKIIDVQGKTIVLETPVFDLKKNKWDNAKMESKKLLVSDNTRILRLSYEEKKEKQGFELVSSDVNFADLKIGDNIQANNLKTVIGIEDFSPTVITILPN